MTYSFSNYDQKLEATLEHIRSDVRTLRTGRASADLMDPVLVEAYGQKMKLVELASINVPDATLLVISPWDKSLVENIEKAIAKAELNLNPIVDGDVIRVPVPTLTEEKRREMVKKLHQKIEAGKAMLRDVRTKAKQDIEAQKGNEGISEDDVVADLETLEEKHQAAVAKLDDLQDSKEKELLSI